MKTSVKFILLLFVLTLTLCVNSRLSTCYADDSSVSSCKLIACPSISCDDDSFNNNNPFSSFHHSIWTADAELGSKLFAETNPFNTLRMRRGVEVTTFLKAIILQLSNREDMLALYKDKLYGSDITLFNVSSSCDYYIFALRRILI